MYKIIVRFLKSEGSLPYLQKPAASQINAVHTFRPHFPNIYFNIFFHLRLGLPISLFPSGFTTTIFYAIAFSPVHATCLAHCILLD
jgi:hypothetical protein